MKQAEIDKLKTMYDRFDWRCFVCSNNATQRAHILSQGKTSRRKWGNATVDNPLNWLPACSLECNACISVDNAGTLPDQIAFAIEDGDRMLIHRLVRENIDRKRGV